MLHELKAAADHRDAIWSKRQDIVILIEVERLGIRVDIRGKHPNGVRCGVQHTVSWAKIELVPGTLVDAIDTEIVRLDAFKSRNYP